MVSPQLILLYARTWKRVFKSGDFVEEDIQQFMKELLALRKHLRCSACHKMLGKSPLSVDLCDHVICKNCIGGTRKEFCEKCKNWEEFKEDEVLSAVVVGHARYCRMFLRSVQCTNLLEMQEGKEVDVFRILEILQEGASIGYSGVVTEIPVQPESEPKINLSVGVEMNKGELGKVARTGKRDVHDNSSRKEKFVKVMLKNNKESEIAMKIEPIYQKKDEDAEMESDSEECKAEVTNQYERKIGSSDEDEGMKEDPLRIDENQTFPLPLPQMGTTATTKTTLHSPFNSAVYIQPSTTATYIPATNSFTIRSSLPPVQRNTVPNFSPRSRSPIIQITPKQLQSYMLTRPDMSTGIRTPTPPQTIRLARLSFPDGRPFTMIRQRNEGSVRHIALPINTSDLLRKQMFIRPNSTQAQVQLRWPDGSSISQTPVMSQVSQVQQKGTVLTMPHIQATNASHEVPSTAASQAVVINANAMNTCGALPQFTNIQFGNIINSHPSTNRVENLITVNSSPVSSAILENMIGPTIVRTDPSSNAAVQKCVAKNKAPTISKSKLPAALRAGCRCGNATNQPSKLTCCGQRCVCYVEGKSCVDCKCRGCNNPLRRLGDGKYVKVGHVNGKNSYIPGERKPISGVNAVIDTNATQLISGMTAASSSTSVTSVAALSTSNSTIVSSMSGTGALPSQSTMNLVSMIPSQASTSMAPHQILTRIHHPGNPQNTTTFSQLIPVANFAGQFGQFTIPLPISLISPSNQGHTIQSHTGETFHLQNIHLNPNLQNQ